MTSENITWRPVKEPIATTLMRTGAIALVVGAILAWRAHDLRQWPLASLLVFWPAFGGHWVEIVYLNYVRSRLPNAHATQFVARLAVWFAGGVVLLAGMVVTAKLVDSTARAHWPAWWIGGVAFIGIELVVHLILLMRCKPNAYGGRA
jgi:hypothetical protein